MLLDISTMPPGFRMPVPIRVNFADGRFT